MDHDLSAPPADRDPRTPPPSRVAAGAAQASAAADAVAATRLSSSDVGQDGAALRAALTRWAARAAAELRDAARAPGPVGDPTPRPGPDRVTDDTAAGGAR